jgi:hypothetical protein
MIHLDTEQDDPWIDVRFAIVKNPARVHPGDTNQVRFMLLREVPDLKRPVLRAILYSCLCDRIELLRTAITFGINRFEIGYPIEAINHPLLNPAMWNLTGIVPIYLRGPAELRFAQAIDFISRTLRHERQLIGLGLKPRFR